MPSTALSRSLFLSALLPLGALWGCAAGLPLGDTVGSGDKDAATPPNFGGDSIISSNAETDGAPALGDGATSPWADPLACESPSPEGCASQGCDTGFVCDLEADCAPSFCACEPDMAAWLCTTDCDGGVCVPEGGVVADASSSGDPGTTTSECSEPNPVGCIVTGCAAGRKCDITVGCAPSSCSCDATTDTWTCTEDCGGGVCVPADALECLEPDPTGCMVTGCPENQVCDTKAGCAPTECWCDTTTGTWGCSPDCEGGVCVDPEAQKECTKPNPVGCIVTGCPANYECDTKLGCAPSSCSCDANTGEWLCTGDCNGGTCKAKIGTISGCTGPNPQGCVDSPCKPGMICDQTVGCVPSSCFCDKISGDWACTDDCNGGTCVEEPPIECDAGTIAVDKKCMACDEVDDIVMTEMNKAHGKYGLCAVDADCVIVTPSSPCYPECPVAIGQKWAALYENFTANITGKYCTGYETSCGLDTDVVCQPGDAPFCSDQVCTIKESF